MLEETLLALRAANAVCISKGKAHKKYEFGNKVSVAVTSKENWILSCMGLSGNPYDGHSLVRAIRDVKRNCGVFPEDVFVDRGYSGHDVKEKIPAPVNVHIDKTRRGKTPQSLWKKMKHRSAIEPVIGHLKSDCRLGRNFLRGCLSDAPNPLFAGAGFNLRKLLKLFVFFFFLSLGFALRHFLCNPFRKMCFINKTISRKTTFSGATNYTCLTDFKKN